MDVNVSEERITKIVNWANMYYGNRLAGVAFFDPSKVDERYPCANCNLLLVLKEIPVSSRERYETLNGDVIEIVFGEGKTFQCRIQTPDELQTLADLSMPLLKIYLQNSRIVHDPDGTLVSLSQGLAPY